MINITKIIHNQIKIANLYHLCKYQFGIIKFNLPDLGQKIKEGTVKKLYIKQGDRVEEFQKLADVSSDKQNTQLTASDNGIITKIYYKQDQVCQVGDLFLEIQTNVKSSHASSTIQTPKKQQNINNQPKQIKQQNKTNQNTDALATPYVRGLIKTHGLNINNIKGTGKNGRILQEDVYKLTKKTQDIKIKPKQQPLIASTINSESSIKMSPFQKGMQKSMTQSNTIPHLYLHEEFDITQIQKMRKSLKENNRKVTVMGILVKTFSLALKQYPKMNSLYYPQKNQFQYFIHPNHNISIAIDSKNGLVVPHIKNVNNLNLIQIQQQLQRLRDLSKQAKLSAKELQGGTVCLSNIGTIGGTHACPLILPPQVCIVAIGKLQSVPRYIGGQLVQRKTINVSYGCDHRVIDGATVARFSNVWKQLIQNPYMALSEMI